MKKKSKKRAKTTTVEIARSFSYKLNVGNYESRDFFCSQKAECSTKDAKKVSEALHDFCKAQVIRDVNKFLAEREAGIELQDKKPEPKEESLSEEMIRKNIPPFKKSGIVDSVPGPFMEGGRHNN